MAFRRLDGISLPSISFNSQISPTYSCQDFEQKPPNHQGTAQRDNLVNYATLRPATYGSSSSSTMDYTIQQPPLYTAINDSGGGSVQYSSSTQNGLLPINTSSTMSQSATDEPSRPDYLHFERSSLEYQRIYSESEDPDKLVANSKTLQSTGQDFRHAEFPATEMSTSVGNHLAGKMPRVNSSSLPKNRNTRNHIITDTLPGPESCV